jgi:cyclase
MTLTRRDFLASSSLAALAATFGRPLATHGALHRWSLNEFTPIRRNVGFFTMRGGTVGYLINPDGIAVVDTQFPTEAQALIAGLNERSGSRPVDVLINSHHHGDHTGGNVAFRGKARKVVAHSMAAEHMRQPPGGQPPADQLFPDTTYTHEWTADLGDERIRLRHYGRAHTSGDSVITFERANVVHMGDLMFNQRHPVVDRAAGAIMRNWMRVLDSAAADHDGDTTYIFGHANTGLPVTGSRAQLANFRDYLGAVLAFVDAQIKAGKSRDQILAMREPLRGFESYGPFGNPGARDPLTVAYEELTSPVEIQK